MANKRKKPTTETATKATEAAKKERVRKLRAELADAMQDLLPDGSFADWEEEMLELTGELRKEATQRRLQAVADGLGEEVKVNGKTYKQHQAGR
jgi:hypothetical protein